MSQVEDERKFSLQQGQELPDLSDVVEVRAPQSFLLTATYVDTLDLALARHRITLRRREGGHDAGWHLKLPGEDGARIEVHAPLEAGPTPSRVPAELRAHVQPTIGNQALVPVAVVANRRTERELRDGDTVLALLADDHVTARHGEDEKIWRELEVELVDGDRPLLDRLTDVLAAGGITVSESPSKLATILGDAPELAPLTPASSAVQVMLAFFSLQVGVLQALDGALRTDEDDAVHKARVATRRLRSVLHTWRPLLERSITDDIRDQLRWFGGVLGASRDAEVLKKHLLADLDALPAAEVRGPVRERLTTSLEATHANAHAALVEAMDSPRYTALCGALTTLLTEPPVHENAGQDAGRVLPPLLQKTSKRTRACWRQAKKLDGFERATMLHETRKKAKAARYGGEALVAAFGAPAKAWAKAWEDVTESFGVLQDAAVAQERLGQLASEAERAGEDRHTYGTLMTVQDVAVMDGSVHGAAAMKKALRMDARTWKL